jgi:AmpE protein
MATALLAAVIALVVGHTVPELARARDFSWFAHWRRAAAGAFGASGWWRGGVGAVIVLGVPTLALLAVQWLLAGRIFGLALLALSTVVLFYCWGPRDLDLDVDAVATAPDAEQRKAAISALSTPAADATLSGTTLIDAVFRAALARWFGVLLWFVLLGPAGALLYRLAQLATRRDPNSDDHDDPQRETFEQILGVLDWPAAQLMTLALAVAADFDAVLTAWRDFHAARGRWFTRDPGFLIAAARASVEADMDGGDSYVEDARGPLAEMADAMALIWRILLVWGVVFALFVLAGKIG